MTTFVTQTKHDEIKAGLAEIERIEGVRILYACESGSRAWGFPSADSDYDVRFIYAHPPEWYLSLETRRDVIERPLEGDLDLSGWDIRKALNLFRRSNPPLLEWLQSPIVYWSVPGFVESLRGLMTAYYDPCSCMHHYLHMARNNFREFLKGERIRTKKYFYVLRPVFACLWLEQGRGPVPTEFQTLVDALAPEGALRDAIKELLANKRDGHELDDGPRIPVFNDFLEAQLARLEQRIQPATVSDANGLHRLDTFFRSVIGFDGASG
ncbi:MAG: nucleotidyltransferase domain-containing protein [Kiritimatiellae bacterium]|nr:nucleotidyltransferase domain-containing protein [Kiritimatiellia bacterium]